MHSHCLVTGVSTGDALCLLLLLLDTLVTLQTSYTRALCYCYLYILLPLHENQSYDICNALYLIRKGITYNILGRLPALALRELNIT